MSNRHASKQHGLVGPGSVRPKSKLRTRRNKANAHKNKEGRIVQMNQLIKQAADKKAGT